MIDRTFLKMRFQNEKLNEKVWRFLSITIDPVKPRLETLLESGSSWNAGSCKITDHCTAPWSYWPGYTAPWSICPSQGRQKQQVRAQEKSLSCLVGMLAHDTIYSIVKSPNKYIIHKSHTGSALNYSFIYDMNLCPMFSIQLKKKPVNLKVLWNKHIPTNYCLQFLLI